MAKRDDANHSARLPAKVETTTAEGGSHENRVAERRAPAGD
jgi:hypothetical protein